MTGPSGTTGDRLANRLLISYPLIFDGLPPDRLGNLRLPKDLTQEEAERVKAMIDSLVIAKLDSEAAT